MIKAHSEPSQSSAKVSMMQWYNFEPLELFTEKSNNYSIHVLLKIFLSFFKVAFSSNRTFATKFDDIRVSAISWKSGRTGIINLLFDDVA